MTWLTEEIFNLFIRGVSLTLFLTLITSLLSLGLGVLTGLFRLSGHRFLRGLAAAHVEAHRNVPALVLLVFWAFAFPNVFPLELRRQIFFDNMIVNSVSRAVGLSVPYYTLAAALALTLNTSAYLAELFRAGVGTIARENLDAARTLGASQWELTKRIVVPQGLRAAFPAVSTRLIHNMKNTALAALVSTPEFFHNIQTAISRSFRAVEFLLLAAVVYLVLSGSFAALLRGIENSLNRETTFSKRKAGLKNAAFKSGAPFGE